MTQKRYLKCPHCRTDHIEYGASVCTGCHAEIYYGIPLSNQLLIIFMNTVSFYMLKATGVFNISMWLVFMIIIAVDLLLAYFLRNRILFSRRRRS